MYFYYLVTFKVTFNIVETRIYDIIYKTICISLYECKDIQLLTFLESSYIISFSSVLEIMQSNVFRAFSIFLSSFVFLSKSFGFIKKSTHFVNSSPNFISVLLYLLSSRYVNCRSSQTITSSSVLLGSEVKKQLLIGDFLSQISLS